MIQQKAPGYNLLLKRIFIRHPYAITVTFVLGILGLLFSLITPLIIKMLVDDVLLARNNQLLLPILASLSVIYIISALSNYLSGVIGGNLGIIVYRELSSDIFSAIQSATLMEIQKFKIGDLLARTIGNLNAIVQTGINTIPRIVITVLSIILPLIIMLSLDNTLTIIVMSPLVLFVLSSWYFGEQIKKSQRPVLDSGANFQSFLKESYSIIPLTKTLGLENWLGKRFDGHISEYNDVSFKLVKVSSLNSAVALLFYGVPTILVLSFGSIAFLNGAISLGTLTAFMAYVGLFFAPIEQLSFYWTSYKGSQASYDRIEEILSLKKDSWGNQPLVHQPNRVIFENIGFSYNSRTILTGFDATFNLGRNYLIGDNGTGKTTLIKLLCGLYSPDSGRIVINEQDVVSINKDSLRNSVSVVFSDSLIFDDTVYENIRVGDLCASREKVIAAAKMAELHDFIMELPDQYETGVGESGLFLSSGEKQKIALARVILRNSPIIIFDEFTRSIDTESKKSILSVIRKLKDRIIIIITHDMTDIESNSNVVYITG